MKMMTSSAALVLLFRTLSAREKKNHIKKKKDNENMRYVIDKWTLKQVIFITTKQPKWVAYIVTTG